MTKWASITWSTNSWSNQLGARPPRQYSFFNSLELQRANADTTDTLNALLATVPDDQLNQALGTLPDNYVSPYRVFVACGLIRESKRRGICQTNYTGGDWHKFRLKRAELHL